MSKTKKLKQTDSEFDLSYGDEHWSFSEKNAAVLWGGPPLSLFKSVPLKGKTLLEMGCGYGGYIYCLDAKGAKVTGIDLIPEIVKAAKVRMKQYKIKSKILRGDVRKLPLKSESFDIVFCNGVIEHFQDSEKAVREGFRVLKPGGLAMYSVPARISSFVILKHLQKLVDKLFGTKLWTCGFEKSFTPWKLKKILRAAGLKIRKFEITQCEPGKRFPFIGKTLRILDKPFHWLGIGGRFMFALCEK